MKEKKLRIKTSGPQHTTSKRNLDSYSAVGFFLPPKEAFFSFEEGCTFLECELMVEKGSWESSLSQMTISIISSGDSQPSSKVFFHILLLIRFPPRFLTEGYPLRIRTAFLRKLFSAFKD